MIALLALLDSPRVLAHNVPQDNESKELSLHAYETELGKLSLLIQKLNGQPSQISQLRNTLPSSWTVDTNGDDFRVSTNWLYQALADLQAHPDKSNSLTREIEFRLAALRRSALELGQPAVGPSHALARSDLNEIFQRPEFASLKRQSEVQLLEARIQRWLLMVLARLLARLHISTKMGNRLAWILIGTVFLLGLYWVIRMLSTQNRTIQMPMAKPDIEENSRMWISYALAAANRAEYREAIHCAYWAAIVRLENMRLLTHDRSRTPRESLRLLDSNLEEVNILQELTDRFELIWYGFRPATQEDWHGAKAQLEKFGCFTA